MAARDDAAPPKLRKLSVIVPVFNERNTVVEILRRMRAVELPDGIEREIIVVDDGSTDGTRDVLRQLGDSTVRVVMHDGEPRQGRGGPHRARARAPATYVLVQDADLEYDPEDWPKLLAPVLRGQGAGRLRLALHRRAPQHAVPALGRQPVPVADHERALQHDALRHGDVLQALRPRAARRASTSRRDRFDIEPEITAKILKRGIRIYEVPISYTGREFDEGKKITWRDGFAALWTLVKYRFRGLSRSRDPRRGPRSSSTTKRGRCSRDCVRSVLADTSAGEVELVVVDNGSPDGSVAALRGARSPTCASSTPPGNVGYARAANLGIAATPRAGRRGAQPRPRVEPGTAAAMLGRASTPSRASRACGPRILQPRRLATTRRPGRSPSARRRGRRTGCSVCGGRRNPFTAPLPPARRRPGRSRATSTGCRAPRSGCAARALDAVGGWDERYFMYMEDVDLCWRLRRAGWRGRVRARRRA